MENVKNLEGGARVLHGRSDLHLARKLFHIVCGLLILYPLWYLKKPTEWMAALLSMMLAAVMVVEYCRSSWPAANSWIVKVLGPFMRQSEVERISGIPFYVASCLFAVLIFPRDIQILAILHLVFGDPFSSFFGVLWGKDKLFPNKSLQGTMGGFLVCALVTAIYFKVEGFKDPRFLLFVVLGGFSGALAELLPVNVDDNLAIPLLSGAFLWLVFWASGIGLG